MTLNGPILLTGAGGQVGFEINRLAAEQRVDLIGLSRQILDIGDSQAVDQTISRYRPGLVINAGAYTAVDKAEAERESAFRANRQGPAHLADACHRHQIPLIHLSTDYVFDGSKSGAYLEDDAAAPTGVYGQSKWEGEEEVRSRLPQHLIIRVSWVFGPHGHNFVKTMVRLAAERDSLQVVADQRGCPTSATDIARTLLLLAMSFDPARPDTPWGTYHYCGQPATTWHEFAEAIVQTATTMNLLNRVIPVHPIATHEYPTPAKRPANSVLDCRKIRRNLAVEQPDWHDGLRAMLSQMSSLPDWKKG